VCDVVKTVVFNTARSMECLFLAICVWISLNVRSRYAENLTYLKTAMQLLVFLKSQWKALSFCYSYKGILLRIRCRLMTAMSTHSLYWMMTFVCTWSEGRGAERRVYP